MHKFEPMGTPLGHHTKLSVAQAPSTEKENRKIKTISYDNEISGIMYEMVCSMSYLAHVVSVVRRYMAYLG